MNTFTALVDDAPSGTYNFDETSKLVLIRNADVKYDYLQDDVDELFNIMYTQPPIPNPRRPSTFLKRSQLTYSPIDYDFGQKTRTLPMDQLPKLVMDGLNNCNKHLEEMGFMPKLNGAHVSMYPDGSAGVDPHADDEEVIDQDIPIVSLSFGTGRRFSFYRHQTDEERTAQLNKSKAKTPPAPKPVRIASVKLQHGDVCFMINMQKNLLHGIDKDPTVEHPRLSLTYRHFVQV